MRYKIQVTSGGECSGISRLIDVPEQGLAYSYNRDYHCPQCGTFWASWVKEAEPLTIRDTVYGNNNYYPVRRSCADHPFPCWTGDIPGSVFMYHSDIAVAPRSILERELLLLTQGERNV